MKMINLSLGLLLGLTLLVRVGVSAPLDPETQAGGWRFMPLPLLNYNNERGVGYGAFLSLFKKPPLSPINPRAEAAKVRYDFNLAAQLYQTTEGYAYHKLIMDAPRLTTKGLRLQLIGGYEVWDHAWYSGVGAPPPIDSSSLSTERYQYQTDSVWVIPTLSQPLRGVHPALKNLDLIFGLTARLTHNSASTESLLWREAPLGYRGGMLILANIGIAWDRRDREPNTLSGFWSELATRYSASWIGSDWEMWGANFTHRHWLPLLARGALTWAIRLGVDLQGGNVPFFQRGVMGGSQWVELGGNSVLKGYFVGRLRGRLSLYSTHELRWRFTEGRLFKRLLEWMLVPSLELGFLSGGSTSPSQERSAPLLASAGLGGRVIYDEAFILRADLSWARERERVRGGSIIDRWRPGFYIIVGHSF